MSIKFIIMRSYLIWSVLLYLRFWAKIALFLNRPYIIGIAGSVGKSSTRNALFAVFKDHFKTKVVTGNSETGVPLGILGLEINGFSNKDWFSILYRAPLNVFNLKDIDYLIVEMGIDDPYPPKNMSYLLTIIKPDMAIDLNATATHTMQFEKLLSRHTKDTLEFILGKIADEDSKIITNGHTKIGIYNNDDIRLKERIEKKAKKVTLLTFGKDKSCAIYYKDYILTTKKTNFSYTLCTEKGEKEVELSFRGMLLPPASRESFAAVMLACTKLGLKTSQVRDSLEANFTIPKGRASTLTGIKNSLIIDSSYNSSKSTVFSFLDMLKILKDRTGRPIVFVMGDMRELGNESKEEHEEVARKLLTIVDELYCVGPLTQEFVMPVVKEFVGKKGKTQRVEWYKNAIQAGLHIKEELQKESIILFKGSQNELYLEEAIKFLLENSNDAKLLCRQEEFWMEKKAQFFNFS